MTEMTSKTRQMEQSAEEAYADLNRQINASLGRLVEMQAKGGMHQAVNKRQVHWGHVGDLGMIAEQLKRITDICFKEGEHAE
jgi:hypothetical protein